MKKKNINAFIDLGSTKIKSAIFDFDENGSELIASSEVETSGINNSLVTNFDKACQSIRSAVGSLENKANLNIDSVTVMIEPTEIITTRLTKFKRMAGSKIEKNDINFLLSESKKHLKNNDQNFSLLHMFNYKYIVDKKIFKDLPINTFCDQLSLENVFISVPKNILKNISEVFHSCDIEVKKFICPSYSNGIFLFEKNQLENGCGIVDIGYEKTSIALFKNSSLVKIVILPIGSNHITKDISKVCYLNKMEAETIKKDYDLFEQFKTNKEIDALLPKKYFINSNFRKIQLKLIHDIMFSRILEIIENINLNIENFEKSESIKKNLKIIGGGSKIFDLVKISKIDFKDKFTHIINSSNDIGSDTLSCESAQSLFLNGWPSEAVAILSQKKEGFFNRFFQFFN